MLLSFSSSVWELCGIYLFPLKAVGKVGILILKQLKDGLNAARFCRTLWMERCFLMVFSKLKETKPRSLTLVFI